MNKATRRTYRNAQRKAQCHMETVWADGVTPSVLEAGAVWYVDEQTFCQALADEHGIPLTLVTTYYAWTSIRQRLAQNKVLTLQACHHDGCVKALPTVAEGCLRAYGMAQDGDDPTESLTGRKTYNFARALQGDTEAVVVDVWMMRAAGWPDRDAPTKLQYDAIEWAIKRMARKYGVAPSTVQAALWIAVRGGAA